MSLLEQLKLYTEVVADTGDVELIKRFKTQDATTNPTLLLAAAQMPAYYEYAKNAFLDSSLKTPSDIVDHLIVCFGSEILKQIPGRVSVQIDPRLSFDTQLIIRKAHKILEMFLKKGISSERIYIKIPSTWEGIQAAGYLESQSIACNLTLLFSTTQAIAAAQVNATLISPYVGRVTEWYCKSENVQKYDPENDPGITYVQLICKLLKGSGYKTKIMGASFRSVEQVLALAGCDLLTISPKLLEELSCKEGLVQKKLGDYTSSAPLTKLSEAEFRLQLNDNPCATEKLAEGIRLFINDQQILEQWISRNFLYL